MTSWGHWTCPKCGNEWLGSIGWYDMLQDIKIEADMSIPREEKPFYKLLVAICGCTGEGITKEQAERMGGVFTRGPNVEREEDGLHESNEDGTAREPIQPSQSNKPSKPNESE